MRISVGGTFRVAARVIADNIILCEVFLLRGKRASAETTIRLDANGNGLPQFSEFTVEVIQ